MKRSRNVITAIAVLLGPGIAASLVFLPSVTRASSGSTVGLTPDQQLVLACGYSIQIESDGTSAQPTRQEAISGDLEYLRQAKDPAPIENRPPRLSNELRVLLLQNALSQLPEAEKRVAAEDDVRVEVPGVGTVVVEATFHNKYVVAALDFYPQLPDKCEQG
jgi:hypothetical protein